MAPALAAALGNAQARTHSGWPLAVLTIAFYAPAGTGLARLVLVAAGLLFLTRRPAGTPARTGQLGARTAKSPAKAPAPRTTETPSPRPAKASAKTTRSRGSNGRFQ